MARAPWRRWLIGRVDRQHVWLATLVLAGSVWAMRVSLGGGLAMHFLLASALTLMHGWHLAVVGLAVVAAANCAFTGDGSSWPLLFLAQVVVPASVAHLWAEGARRYLPHNYWIFFFVTAFGGSMLAFAASGVALRATLSVPDVGPVVTVSADYFVVLAMMSFGEATLNGFILAGATVLRPDWVASYEPAVRERR